MLRQSNTRLIAFIDRLTLLVALLVALVLPLGFSSLAYWNLVDHVEVQARVKAGAITGLISGNPGLWAYQVQRIEEVLARYPAPLSAASSAGEAASAYDANGVRIVSVGNPPAPPLLRRSQPLYDSGRVVGRVEVAHSMREWLYSTALAALLGLLLGGTVYGMFRAWPLRELRRVNVALEGEQAALRESEARYRTLTEWTPEPFIVHRGGKLIYINPAAVKMFGATSAQDLIGRPFLDVVHPDFHQIVLARAKNISDHGVRAPMAEMRFLKLDGTPIDVEVEGTSIVYSGALAIHVSIRDITAHKQMQDALRESEARFRSVWESSTDGMRLCDVSGKIISVNPAYCSMVGRTLEELNGKSYAEAYSEEESERRLQKFIKKVVARTIDAYFEKELTLRKGDKRWFAISNAFLNSVSGATVVLSIFRDITERKHAEAAHALLEAQLRESQKMQAIGTLAGGIAHDFNNILATILGNVELARQDVSANPQVLESLEEIRKAGSRARDLVQQILSFSRRQPTERKLIALAPVVEESARLLRATLPARVTLEAHCDVDVPAVVADANQIQQILINLATNAMQAIQDRPGRIVIRLDTVIPDAALMNAHPALRALCAKHPGRTVRLAVSDDGPGMDAATLARIFEPFFTTKAVDQGTGLGLSVAHGIVQAHEGAIMVDSRPGQGATFTVYLPAAEAQAGIPAPDKNTAASAATPDNGSGRHILYLDDDESLVFLVRRLLERRGYRISGYTDQQEALDALRADPTQFDLVVTDYNMPGMSGLDVAREVRTIRANLPVAVASGFIDETLRAQAEGAGVRELIFKANAVEDLCEAFARLAQSVGETTRGR